MAFDDPDTRKILAFLARIGISVTVEPVADDTLLPAMQVCDGGLVVDAERLAWPGDMLHEAGHIAVTEPALRPTLCEVRSDPAEEMAAIAWSYAAAVAIGIDAAVVFHAEGYRGGGANLVENFTQGRYFGHPMLEYWGMAARKGDNDGVPAYPHMLRWLR